MASQNSRTVTLTLDTQTTGTEGVKALANELRQLAKTGGETGGKFDVLAEALERAEQAERQQASAVARAKQDFDAANRTLLEARAAVSKYTAEIGGARKASAEQAAELERLRQATLTAKAAVDQQRASVAGLQPALAAAQAEMRQVSAEASRMAASMAQPAQAAEESAKKTEGAFSGLVGKLRGLAGPLAAAFGVGQWFQANTELEALRRTLTALTGSSEAAAKEIEYLKSVTNRLGIDTASASRAYMGLQAAAKGTALEGKATRDIFEAVAGSMSKLGKSSADTEGALQAVSQMVSKGTVSMEEMRQQLAERLPGAMQAAADASGVTVGELTDMIATGQVLASDLLPRLAEGLKKLYANGTQVDGLQAALKRLKNSFGETLQFIGDSGMAKAVATAMEQAAIAVRGLTGAFMLLGQTIGITAAAIVNFDLSKPIASFAEWKRQIGEAADEIETKMAAANKATTAASDAQAGLAEQSRNATQAADGQGVSWLGVVNAYSKVAKAAGEAVALSLKSAAAVGAEQKAATELANAFGSEVEKREAAQTAADLNAEALQRVAEARRIESETARSNAIALAESAAVSGQLTEEKRKAIQAVNDHADKLTAEANAATAAALSAQQHAAALATEKSMLEDNSGRVDELRVAYEKAADALALVKEQRRQGIASMADEQAAAIAAAAAGAIYRDALADITRAAQTAAQVQQQKMNIEQAGIRLQIEQQRSIVAAARARGDEYTATAALLEIKKLEIKLAELTAKAKFAEAEAALLVVKAKREELTASGQMTAAKKAELDAQEAAAQVKKIEGQIAAETAKSMQELYDQTARGTQAAISAAEGYDQLADSLNGVQNAANGAASAVSGVRSAAANVGPLGEERAGFSASPESEARKMGYTDAQIDGASSYFAEAMNQELSKVSNSKSRASIDLEAVARRAVAVAMARSYAAAAESGTDGMTNNSTNPEIPQSTFQVSQPERKTTTERSTQTVRVELNMGGRMTPVTVASTQDANSLVNFFNQLESDMRRAM